MSNATPSRTGQVNGAGGTDALFLKLFAGEILGAFNTKNVAKEQLLVRSIDEGKSRSFPATGLASGGYHTAGNEILGSSINHNEVIILVDNIYYSDAFVAEIDELMNHWNVRSEYSKQMGEHLAETFDENAFIAMVLAARASANVTGLPGGSQDTMATGNANAAAVQADTSEFKATLYAAAQKLDENNVTKEGRKCYVKPDLYYALAQDSSLFNVDFRGDGSLAQGKLNTLAGIEIVMSNNMPSTNIAANPTGANNTYSGDFSDTAAIVCVPGTAGCVERKGVTVESTYDNRRFGTLLTARQVYGIAPLRPECAYEILYSAT